MTMKNIRTKHLMHKGENKLLKFSQNQTVLVTKNVKNPPVHSSNYSKNIKKLENWSVRRYMSNKKCKKN